MNPNNSTMTLNQKVYRFEFCNKHWSYYNVYENGSYLVHFNTKSIKTARNMLREWLNTK